jgi:large subunit ribosomal protein L22
MIIKNQIFSAKIKYNRISPLKLYDILSKIVKKSYIEIIYILKNIKKRAVFFIWNIIKSIVSNIYNLYKINKKNFIILEAYATKSITLKKIYFKARGKTFVIRKRMSHITIKMINIKKV